MKANNYKRFPPPGQLHQVNGHSLHLYPKGNGSPTVLLEAGGASWSLDWHLVQEQVASFTSVCSYDRAGFGWTDLGPSPLMQRRWFVSWNNGFLQEG
jgi:pimeloyl-ACP methyl ester carboxylesterase